jgi:broad specificity phosphatase PhoE
MPTTSEIVIVRHGETEWSIARRHTGRTDLSLIDAGRQRAAELAPVLGGRSFALVLVSPLRRARETCELAGFGDRAEICADLREWDYGDYEGRTTSEIREENPDWVLWRDGCPGGETPNQIAARVQRALDRLRAADGDAIAFAHGHILRALTARYLQMPLTAGARFVLGAGAFSTLGYEHENEAMLHWNDTGE